MENKTMKAKLTKISHRKMSYNGDVDYYRLNFQLEDGSFAQTDVVPSYRNYAWWEPIVMAGVGTVIDHVMLRPSLKAKKIDADCQPVITKAPLFNHPQQQDPFL